MAVGNCNCVRVGTFNPEVDDVDELPAQRERLQPDAVEQTTHPTLQSNPHMPKSNGQYAEFSDYVMPPRMNSQDGTADPMITHPNLQSNSQMSRSNGQFAEFSDYVMPPRMNSHDGTAESSHSFAEQNSVQPQQHLFELSSNDPAITAARQSRPVEGTPVSHQEQSQPVTSSQSLAPAQGNGAPQQRPPNSNVYFDPKIRPAQPNFAHLQPQFSPYGAYQSVLNGNNTPEHPPLTSSNLSRLPETFPYSMNPAHPTTLYQKRHFEDIGHIYPERCDPYPMHEPREMQPEDFNLLTNHNDCSCGPGCNCVYCRQHPYNPATLERVRHLSHIVELDNYEIENPRMTRPQSAIWGAPINGTLPNSTFTRDPHTNGTNGSLLNGTNGPLTNGTDCTNCTSSALTHGMNGTVTNGTNGTLTIGTNGESIMGQAYPQLESEFPGPGPPPFVNLHDQGPASQSVLNEGPILSDGNQSNEVHSRTMRTSDYYTIEYPADLNCPNSPGTCPCPAHSWARSLTL